MSFGRLQNEVGRLMVKYNDCDIFREDEESGVVMMDAKLNVHVKS
jgi:hypothetical protein